MTLEDDLRQIEGERAALYALVRTSSATLVAQPSSGEWSVIQNLRHLLYAEERHLLRRLTPGFTWTAIGLPTRGIVKRSGAGSASTDDVDEVLAAWDATHERVLSALRDAPAGLLPDRLAEGNLRHLRAHVRTIGKLLATPPQA